jgi:catechol 2,3-dioxygenase-like lactoylglutathione lyase family enzyme
MFDDATIVAMVASADLPAAKAFYGGTLGMSAMEDNDWLAVYTVRDRSSLVVYGRPGHVAPPNTCATLLVDDVPGTAAELRAKGISLIEYDMPDIKTENGIWDQPDGGKAAWFRDPDGNILSVQSRPPQG